MLLFVFLFVKPETAYEMRISDLSSDVCSSDLFDHLLDNLSLYWFTGTAGSSFRLYHENNVRSQYRHAEVNVPTGVARFGGEPFRWPRSLVEKNYRNIQDWQELPKGDRKSTRLNSSH